MFPPGTDYILSQLFYCEKFHIVSESDREGADAIVDSIVKVERLSERLIVSLSRRTLLSYVKFPRQTPIKNPKS